MRNKPNHTCFSHIDCSGCAFELGEQSAKKKHRESVKYVWMVVGSDNPCDIRRYAFSHREAIAQLSHTKRFKDKFSGGEWVLFKLQRVNRKKLTPNTLKE